MDSFETQEGKILYLAYNLYRSNRIDLQQKNEIKDRLIQKDNKILKLMQELEQDQNIESVEYTLENINDLSSRDLDDSMSHTYKNKRPKRFAFHKSNFTKVPEIRANEDTDCHSHNSHYQCDTRRRVFSLASGSCS